MRSCRHFTPALLLGLTLLAASPTAVAQPAQPTDEAKFAAKALADKGWEFFNAGRYEDALTAFRDAEAQVHAPPFLVMAARSCERLGRLLEARSLYQRVLDEPLAATAPLAFQQAQADAKAELAALTPRIPTLEVDVTGAAQARVQLTLDGRRIAPATPVERDPGDHTLVGVLKGHPPVTRTIRLDEKAKRRVVLDLAPPSAEAPPAHSAPATSEGGLRKALFIGGGVAAGVGVIAGTAFTILSVAKANDSEELREEVRADNMLKGRCPSTESPAVCAKLSDMVDFQYAFINVAIGSFIVGGAGVGTVVNALVDRPSAPDRRVQVAPLVGSGVTGLSLSGRF